MNIGHERLISSFRERFGEPQQLMGGLQFIWNVPGKYELTCTGMSCFLREYDLSPGMDNDEDESSLRSITSINQLPNDFKITPSTKLPTPNPTSLGKKPNLTSGKSKPVA